MAPPPSGGLGEILRRIVLTSLVSGSLGLAAYAGFAAATGSPSTPFILVILLAAPFAALCLWQVAEGLRSGTIVLWHGAVGRDRQPGSYRFAMGLYSLGGLALAALVAWSGWRLVQAVSP